jgi:hypothetical protein
VAASTVTDNFIELCGMNPTASPKLRVSTLRSVLIFFMTGQQQWETAGG